MCRLFGLHAGTPVSATFWLLDAPDSLSNQSHRDPDGAGIGVFGSDGTPVIDKQPMAAWEDREFAAQARSLTGTTFVAHVRYASSGQNTLVNTHPFSQDGRIFAHNGAVGELDTLDRELARRGVAGLVGGQTDSERIFALITASIGAHEGDVDAGIAEALTWCSEHLPVFALNIVLATPLQLWAVRYPDTHELHILERPEGGHRGDRPLHAHSHRIHAESAELHSQRSVVIASERMDDDPGWRLLNPGEVIRVDADLTVHSSSPLPRSPARQLTLADLDPKAAASQHPAPGA